MCTDNTFIQFSANWHSLTLWYNQSRKLDYYAATQQSNWVTAGWCRQQLNAIHINRLDPTLWITQLGPVAL